MARMTRKCFRAGSVLLASTLLLACGLTQVPDNASCVGRWVYLAPVPKHFHADLVQHWPFTGPSKGFGWPMHGSTSQEYFLKMADSLKHLEAGRGRTNDTSSNQAPKWVSEASHAMAKTHFSSPVPIVHRTPEMAFSLLFYSRLMSYPCLTDDYQLADAVYIPYLMFIRQRLGRGETFPEDMRELADALVKSPAWKRMGGRDHFVVWEELPSPHAFRAQESLQAVIRVYMEARKSEWEDTTTAFSAPYPTVIHPPDMGTLESWRAFVKAQKRTILFNMCASVDVWKRAVNGRALRQILMWQCKHSSRCAYFPMMRTGQKAHLGHNRGPFFLTLNLFSQFCLQPRGDSCTRRGVITSMMTGCIPVVFENCSLESQWPGHIPPVVPAWFVQIPLERLRRPPDFPQVQSCNKPGTYPWPQQQQGAGPVCLEDNQVKSPEDAWVQDVLESIPQSEVDQMRMRMLESLPRLVYGGVPTGNMTFRRPDFNDSFDTIISNVLRLIKSKKKSLKL